MCYEIFKHRISIENEEFETYGIVLYSMGNEVLRVFDVSTDYSSLSKFVESINETRLDPFCLGKTLEKYLNDY